MRKLVITCNWLLNLETERGAWDFILAWSIFYLILKAVWWCEIFQCDENRSFFSALYAETSVSLVSSHLVVPTHSGVVIAHHGLPPESRRFLTESKFYPSPHTMCGQVLQRSICFIICPPVALTMNRLLKPYKQDPQERLDKKKHYNDFFLFVFLCLCVCLLKQSLPEVSEQTKVIIGIIIAADLHCHVFNKETLKGERYLGEKKKLAVAKRYSIPLSSKIIKGLMRS